MILIEPTIKYKGYDPNSLSKGSAKRICVSCDQCGRVRWIKFYQYRDLCNSCKQISLNNPNYKGGLITLICQICNKEFKTIQSRKNSKFCSTECHGKWMSENLVGENSSNWKGGEIIKICKYCNKKFESQSANNKLFCSRICMGKWQSKNNVGENNSNWKGGYEQDRSHLLNEKYCIQLNQRFKGSEGHHITKSIIIYIPTELHKHIMPHSLKTGLNMDKINMLALQFINGEL